jgi:predicted ester cyclase
MRLYDEVINAGNIDVIDEIYGRGYRNHAAPFGLSQTVEGLKDLMRMFKEGFPNQQIRAEEVLVCGDRVISRWSWTGTHSGRFVGVLASGVHASFSGIDIERVETGRIYEHWGAEDMLGLMNGIGAVRSLP